MKAKKDFNLNKIYWSFISFTVEIKVIFRMATRDQNQGTLYFFEDRLFFLKADRTHSSAKIEIFYWVEPKLQYFQEDAVVYANLFVCVYIRRNIVLIVDLEGSIFHSLLRRVQ